jgi:hypothetical protein
MFTDKADGAQAEGKIYCGNLQNVLRPKGEESETISFRKGKRIMLPAKDVERLYQQQRKRVVQVT